jgi:hypothetical protein
LVQAGGLLPGTTAVGVCSDYPQASWPIRIGSKDDFGLDGEIEVVVPKSDGEGYQTTGGILKVQAKSGHRYVVRNTLQGFSTPVDKSDLELWNACNYPVLLIVYHPTDDKLYWKDVRTYVRTTPSVFKAPHRVEFDKAAEEFTPACHSQLLALSAASPPRISTSERERLLSNLLPIKALPDRIHYAWTDYTHFQQIKNQLQGRHAPAFVVTNGRIFSLSAPSDIRCALYDYCDPLDSGTVETEEWIREKSLRNHLTYLLNALVRSHLRACGLSYSPEFRRHFFPRENETSDVFRRNWFSVRTDRSAPARITAKLYKYGRDQFWRHLAANVSVQQFGRSWYLMIVPQYHFTEDGQVPWISEKVGPYATRQKAQEHNSQVMNHVLFWSDVLAQGAPEIRLSLSSKTVMVIDRYPCTTFAGFSIPDDPASYEEPQPTYQLDLFQTTNSAQENDVNEY